MFETYEDFLRWKRFNPNGWDTDIAVYADEADINRFCEEFNMSTARRISIPGNGPTSGSYIIGSVTGESVSFATTPKVHLSKTDAQAEAERLARANPGKEFILVKVEGRVKVNGVQWK